MTIRILELLYIASPIIGLLFIIAILFPRLRRHASIRTTVLLGILVSGGVWCYSAFSLMNIVEKINAFGQQHVPYGSDQSDVHTYFGSSPSITQNPAYSMDGKPQPEETVLIYNVNVPPFRMGISLRFHEDDFSGFYRPNSGIIEPWTGDDQNLSGE